jgi:chromatin modification-related protein VID21
VKWRVGQSSGNNANNVQPSQGPSNFSTASSDTGGSVSDIPPSGISLVSHPQPPQQSVYLGFGRPAVPWNELEENILKSLVDRYWNNWGLIHDSFRSDRRIRSGGECERGLWELVERYAQLVNAAPRMDHEGMANHPGSREGSVRGGSAQAPAVEEKGMKTRGVKRRATANAANGPAGSPTPSNITVTSAAPGNFKVPVIPGWESKRRRRHLNIGDAIKKIMKKRETETKSSTFFPRLFDSWLTCSIAKPNKVTLPADHGNMNGKGRILSPAELSRMKFEKDQKEQMDSVRQREILQLQYHQRIRASYLFPFLLSSLMSVPFNSNSKRRW